MTDHGGGGRPQQINLFWRFIRRVAEFIGLVAMRWRVQVTGLEHVPADGPAVLVYNHHSYFDFVMVAWNVVRKLRRPLRFLAKAEIWESWKARWIVNAALAIPVYRGSTAGRHGALAAAEDALRAGDLVVVAPEQTVSRSFELLPFRTGAVRMAQATGTPIVPVIGWGTHRFLTKGHRPHWARGATVVVRYGEPIHVAPDEDPRAATERVREVMAAMLDDVQRNYPDRPARGDDWWVPARLGGSAPTHDEVLAEEARRRSRWGEGDASGGASSQAS